MCKECRIVERDYSEEHRVVLTLMSPTKKNFFQFPITLTKLNDFWEETELEEVTFFFENQEHVTLNKDTIEELLTEHQENWEEML